MRDEVISENADAKGDADHDKSEQQVTADAPGNDFNLTPNPAAPLNVFVPLRTLARLVTGDADPKCNALLSSGATAADLTAALRPRLRPEDFGLKFREVTRRKYLSVESDQLIRPSGLLASLM